MTTLSQYLSRHSLGAPVTFQNLTVFPLLLPDPPADPPGYLLLDEALAQDLCQVTEISDAGSVPELYFLNNAALPVLLLDGEELVGAKQNRVLNLTVLAPARSKIVIPVSCVESGRWHAENPKFQAAPHAQHASGRARRCASVTESIVFCRERRSDQQAVWSDIEQQAQRLRSHSRTHAMGQIFEDQRPRLDAYLTAFPTAGAQSGALFCIGGEVAGLDLFDHPRTFQQVAAKLLRSYAFDALDTPEAPAPSLEAVQDFLSGVAKAPIRTEPAIGLGTDWRLAGNRQSGGGLVVEDRLIHLYAFRQNGVSPATHIQRRRHHS
jgi:hypothetical protein